MATRDDRSRAATVPPAGKPAAKPAGQKSVARIPQTSAAQAGPRAANRAASLNLPFETHRIIASVALVLLILLTLLAPLSQAAIDPSPFIAPRADGSVVVPGFDAADVESTVFPYMTFVERQQGNLSSTWPDIYGIINNEPDSLEGRRAIIGQIFGSTSNVDIRVIDSGLSSNPGPDLMNGIIYSYQSMTSDEKKVNFGLNGLGLTDLIQSITAPTAEQRGVLERDAITAFQTAASQDPNTWEFSYNWALANFLVGNYATSYEGMSTTARNPASKNFYLPTVMMGLASLRVGQPDEAIKDFNAILNYKLDPSATTQQKASYQEATGLAREALGDAQWARRDPATAYQTYLTALSSGTASGGLYRKWLRLGLQQRGYEQMLSDMDSLLGQGLPTDLQGRIHHDRARLLNFLGRTDAAMSEYKQALIIGQNDPPLLISYGQALLSTGDSGGALSQAEAAIHGLGKDPSAGDMAAVASTMVTNTTGLAIKEAGQELLDAHLLRAGAWSKQNNGTAIDNLVSNITSSATGQPDNVAALLYLYGGYAYEAAGNATSGDAAANYYSKASDNYKQAWDRLKGQAQGAQGRAASLIGEARTTALAKGKSAQDGLAVLKDGGYDPAAISPKVSTDPDASDILYAGATLLEKAGQQKDAVNAFRVSGVVRNLTSAQDLGGVGRPLWMGNGTSVPAEAMLSTADAARLDPSADPGTVVMRYKQAYGLDSALAPAWNNLGVWYAQQGNPAIAQSYLELSGLASPNYALGNHNLASQAYNAGIGNFLTAEKAQGDAIKASGAETLNWGYNLRYDERGSLPSPSAPPIDFLSRLGALLILLLLLLHTLVGNDRMTNRMGLIPTRGLIGRLATIVDARVKTAMPALVAPGSSARSLAIVIGVPAVIGMFGLAWSAGHGSFGVALVYLPVALVAAALAFAANEVAQSVVARRNNASTSHHLWPVGVLLGIVSIPFGFMYGWQNVTRLQSGDAVALDSKESSRASSRKGRTTDEIELEQEALAEAAADSTDLASANVVAGGSLAGGSLAVGVSGGLGLSPAARIMFAGMVANLVLGLVLAIIYWLTGWPSMRLGLFASMLVLAFTSVSEPPADGWTIYRRNAPLWLAVFVLASAAATLLALGMI